MELLSQQAQYAVEANEMLIKYLNKPGEKFFGRIKQIEKDADEIRRILVDELNRTFVTPIDREDINALSRNLDDVVDYAYTTAEEMEILGIKPNSYLKRMATLLLDGSVELQLAARSSRRTELRIRVGVLGNEAQARLVLEQIHQSL